MNERTTELIGQFMARRVTGRQPDIDRLFAEVGPEDRAAAARTLDLLLQAAPAPAPSQTAELAFKAWTTGESVLRSIRVDRGLSVKAVARRVRAELGDDRDARSQVLQLLTMIDHGIFGLDRLEEPVRSALERALGVRLADIPAWLLRPQPGTTLQEPDSVGHIGRSEPASAPLADDHQDRPAARVEVEHESNHLRPGRSGGVA